MNTRTGESGFRIGDPAAAAVRQTTMVLHPGGIWRWHRGLPADRDGVRIRRLPSSPAAPVPVATATSGVCERVRLRAVPGLRPGRPADAGPAAAAWFARHGDVGGVPDRGWQQAGRHGRSATVRSGPVTLHVVQGSDRTWQVDSGSWCS